MQYREIPPTAALSRHVQCFWTLNALPAGPGEPETVVPDGRAELIINRADRFRQCEPDGGFCDQPTTLLAGQMSRPLHIEATGAIDLVGIRFQPGGLFPLLGGLSLNELAERRVDLEAVSPALARRLRDAASHGDSLQRIQQVLAAEIERHEDVARRLTERATTRILTARGDLTMHALSRETGASGRTLQRAFQREVGIGPKLLARITRFQRFLQAAGTSPAWGALALDCGYYDQAHLNRDFRRFTGKSPTAYLQAHHALNDFFTDRSVAFFQAEPGRSR